jgi:predicted phosphoadenosine phosphosulfate sulfurtransferase
MSCNENKSVYNRIQQQGEREMSERVYKEMNVFDASIERLDFIYANFDKVYLSFSGGKDSGVMLNLVLDYIKERGITTKLGIQIMDNEANYEASLDFMKRIIDNNREYLDVYWCCLPITLPCTVSSYEIDWKCWGVDDEHRWIRPMMDMDYVVNINNHPFGDKFTESMHYDKFWDMFAEWYADGQTTANLIGIRTQESLNRFRAIMNDKKVTMEGKAWTKKNTKNSYNVYPIYDWRTRDVWIANEKFDWDYNTLYDTFYLAGVPIEKMRVASPFMSESKSSLNLYRVIDGNTWARLCARVSGANFLATYGKQLSYSTFTLPEGHTWKSFVKFLLDTLPEESGLNFKERFIQSIKFWGRVGRGLRDDIVEDLEKNNVKFKLNGLSPHGSGKLKRVIIRVPPDHLDFLKSHNSEVTSWKRFAITILKNDHTCKYLGLQPTQELQARQKVIQKKYSKINGDKK